MYLKFCILTLLFTVDLIIMTEDEKREFCNEIDCEDIRNINVCGIREEGDAVRFRLFENECELLEYGCQVNESDAYGLIKMDYCEKHLNITHQLFNDDVSEIPTQKQETKEVQEENQCSIYECSLPGETVCGIRKDGEGFRIKLFANECKMLKNNCLTQTEFNVTDLFICNGLELSEEDSIEKFTKRIVIVNNTFFNYDNDMNETITNFFAGTHVLDMPLVEMGKQWNETTRRRIVKNFGPVLVFKPFTRIPKNRSDDHDHLPTLNSCYHKCPTKCPDTYAPVCGMPGIIAREPSVMFQNHCYMDVAQCKMFWENKSYTALTSTYVETTFLFCLGDSYNAVYRFLPLVRTLQRMGRLKKKGFFRYKIRNMKFMNELLTRDLNVMG